jgi:methionine sulfoxide reductase heme-binding subunit
MSINNLFGFLALITYLLTLIPSNLAKVFPHTTRWKINCYLLKQRRFLGLTAFALSLDHVIISLNKYHIGLLSLETYKTYYTGIFVFIIFAILAFTSNDWSIRQLTQKKWKLLHQLTYVALVLLLLHILGLMNSNWTFLTPIGLHITSLVFFMYVTRLLFSGIKVIRQKNQASRQLPKLLPTQAKSTEKACQKLEI